MIHAVAGASAAAAQGATAPGAAAAKPNPIAQEEARQFSELMASPRTVLQAPQTVSTMVSSAVSKALSGLNVNAVDTNGELQGAMSATDSIMNDHVTADLFRVSTEKMTQLMVTTSIASAGTSTFKSVLHNNE
jgi:hypothetical protein